MKNTIALERNQVPAALRLTYTGSKFAVTICDSVALVSRYWDGGTRSTWRAVRL